MSDKESEMWAALEAYQPTADLDGHGKSWRVMCEERTREAAVAAYFDAPAGSAAAWYAGSAAARPAAAAEAAWYARAADTDTEADRYAQNAIDAIKREVKP